MTTEHDALRIFDPDGLGENPKDRVGATKPPLDLIPPSAEILESLVLATGRDKYGRANWRAPECRVRSTIYVAAARRHLAQWLDGEDDDPESGISHLAHARACLGILIDAIETDHAVDDRPPKGVASELIARHTRERTPDR